MIRSVILARVLEQYGFTAKTKMQVPEIIWRGSEACVKAYLRALFQTDGTVKRLAKTHELHGASRIESPIIAEGCSDAAGQFRCLLHGSKKRRDAGHRLLPDGKGGRREYACKADYELIIDGESRDRFMEEIGFLTDAKNAKYREWRGSGKALQKSQRFTSRLSEIEYVGREAVFDTTQEDNNTLIFNGLVTGNAASNRFRPMAHACWVRSISRVSCATHSPNRANLIGTNIAKWCKVFTRMLDNVVEINGLPLEQQRDEIMRKRRHGMGYLGARQHDDAARHEVWLARVGEVHRGCVARDGARRLGSGAGAGARERARADHERGVHGHEGDAAQASGDGARRLEGGSQDSRAPAARANTAATCSASLRWRRSWSRSWREVGARFTHHTSIAPTGHDLAVTGQQCLATASSLRSRTTISAT